MICIITEACTGVVLAGGRLHAQFFVDPSACIDCGRCADVCPAGAVFSEECLPAAAERR